MENNNITIEEVKKVADEKRRATNKKIGNVANADLAQKRLENLAKGREIRKQKLMEAKNTPKAEPIPEPIPEPISKPEKIKRGASIPVLDEEVKSPQRKPKQTKRQNSIEQFQSFNKLEESINNIKELITNQNINNLKDEIINAVKPISKPKKIKTPKERAERAERAERVVNKTLDLTISDAEISNIINPKEKELNDYKNKGDEKLASFLKALQKK
jgi:hypothetical protein